MNDDPYTLTTRTRDEWATGLCLHSNAGCHVSVDGQCLVCRAREELGLAQDADGTIRQRYDILGELLSLRTERDRYRQALAKTYAVICLDESDFADRQCVVCEAITVNGLAPLYGDWHADDCPAVRARRICGDQT